jgi:hypothetical protein
MDIIDDSDDPVNVGNDDKPTCNDQPLPSPFNQEGQPFDAASGPLQAPPSVDGQPATPPDPAPIGQPAADQQVNERPLERPENAKTISERGAIAREHAKAFYAILSGPPHSDTGRPSGCVEMRVLRAQKSNKSIKKASDFAKTFAGYFDNINSYICSIL